MEPQGLALQHLDGQYLPAIPEAKAAWQAAIMSQQAALEQAAMVVQAEAETIQ
jgi:hypothetical protein